MNITAICTAKNEPHLGEIVTHLRTQGVDRVVISCEMTDYMTLDAIGDVERNLRPCLPGPFDQGAEMTALAQYAGMLGTDWIIPFDADEYWIGTGGTIRQILEYVPPQITVIHAAMYLHLDRTRRAVHQKPLGKVAVRPADDLVIHWGSHGTNRQGEALHGVLQVREIQYASWEHFLRKVETARQLHSTGTVPPGTGTHMERLTHLDETELRRVYDEHCQTPTIEDPIP